MSAPSQRRFRFKGMLGQGGFGVVYRATLEDGTGFQTEVAIKLLKTEELPVSFVARFRDEARLLGLLRDRAVVKVFPVAKLNGMPALVMEYVDGASLAQLLKLARKSLPPRVVAEVIQETARALDVVGHQEGPDGKPLGLIHRDIKPANIQVTCSGSVKVLDFGIAKAAFEARESVTTSFFGTMLYVAPERMMGKDLPAGDVFSLGATLRRCAFGQRRDGPADFTPSKIPIPDTGPLAELYALAEAMTGIKHAYRPTAREVEDQLAMLAPKLAGDSLRRWAEAHVHTPELDQDERFGEVLTDDYGMAAGVTQAAASTWIGTSVAPSVSRPVAAAFVGGFGMIGAGVLLFVGLAALLVWSPWATPEATEVSLSQLPNGSTSQPVLGPSPPTSSGPSSVPQATAATAPVSSSSSTPEVQRATPRTSMPSRKASALGSSRPASTKTTTAPARPRSSTQSASSAPRSVTPDQPPPPGVGNASPALVTVPPPPPPAPKVRVHAPGVIVLFVGKNGQRVGANKVSSGSWTVMAGFDPKRPADLKEVAHLDLKPGDDYTVRCAVSGFRCAVKRAAP